MSRVHEIYTMSTKVSEDSSRRFSRLKRASRATWGISRVLESLRESRGFFRGFKAFKWILQPSLSAFKSYQ